MRLKIDVQGLRKMTEDAIKREEEVKLIEWSQLAEATIKEIPTRCENAANKGRSSVVIMRDIDNFVKRSWWVFGKQTLSGPLKEVVLACNEAGLTVEIATIQRDYGYWQEALIARW